MSASMNDIKNKISSTQNMSKITKAMQMVSASKLTKSESRLKNHQNYLETLENILSDITHNIHAHDHILFQPKSVKPRTAYLVITSDRGLVGGYNNNVLKAFFQTQKNQADESYKLYLIGTKAFDYARRQKLTPENAYEFVPDDLIYSDVTKLISMLIKDYLLGEVSEVVVVYSHFVSKLIQMPKVEKVLPLAAKDFKKGAKKDYIFKPDQEKIVERILLDYLSGLIYGFILNSKLSEHVSRMNAMQNATDNAQEIIHETQLIYNRARQAAITQEITEIVAGSVVLK